ncbi:uncharacterized protein [Takifugu rubripes]|uniref:uncharacterized protein n=1 Tax=Takifugu rubripes TaxID=31033 RepID=UPI0011452462|nr:uncharacterized protein LOC105418706 [Takifugu rubripes]XP_011617223.2 uncharacterized protein LOC105418706 [Takifugu rubripes]XP_011617224.2 uncharacterized protein LOC105418706 [Takifugu rubripes]XP_011617225.2 uncharacterized protein LOC105418706 [Takifugu rubripes]
MADRIKWCHVCETAGDEEDLKELERALPPGYQHLVCAFKAEEQRVVLKVKLTLREQVENWLKDFQLSSSLTWRKARTYPESGRYNTYRADFRCQHNTYGAERSPKNTNCRATLFLVLKRSMEDRRSRSTDRHMVDGYLLYVNWRNNHNHLIVCGQAPSKRGVSTTTQERLTNEGDSNSAVPISSGTTWHNVNPVLRCCTCPVGVSGANCKHQRAVLRAVDVMEVGPASRTPELRRLFYEISCGGPTPEKWCEGSDLQGPVVEQDEHEVADDDNNGHCAGTSPKTISDASTECPKRRLEHFVDSLKRKLDTDNSFTAPVKAFVDTFDKLKTDSALQSSLFSFGERHTATSRGFLQTGAAIGVRTTALARRKVDLGGRRTTGAAIRPKSSRKEHGYCKQSGENSAAPLNLSFCVQDSSSGKTH